jgi:hypothetical protein
VALVGNAAQQLIPLGAPVHRPLAGIHGITLRLTIENNGTVPATGTATVIGRQGGVIVHRATLDITDGVGGGQTRYSIDILDPSPFDPGQVTWSVTLDVPGDRDGIGGDVATATTIIAT